MATLSQDQIDQLLSGLDTRQMPSGQFIWTDKNGNSYTVSRDASGNLSFPDGGQPIDSKTATSKQGIKTFADGTTHIVTNNPDGTVAVGDAIAQKAGKVLEGKVEKMGDGFHIVTYDASGKPQVDPQIVSPLPGKNLTLTPGQRLRNGPDGLHSVNDDGSLGPLVAAKPAKEWAPGTADKNAAVTGKYDAEANKLTQGFLATYGPQIAVIHKAVNDGSMTADQGQQAIDGLTQQAVQEARTGMTAAQQATIQTTQRGQDVTEGNNRASNAASVFNAAQSTAMDAAKNGAGGPAAAGGFLAMLHAAPGFQASMGGSPVVTDDHKQQIASLVMGGMHFPDAVRAVAAKAGVTPGTDAPSVDNGGQVDPNAVSGSEPGPGNFLSNAGAGGLPPGVYQGGAFS